MPRAMRNRPLVLALALSVVGCSSTTTKPEAASSAPPDSAPPKSEASAAASSAPPEAPVASSPASATPVASASAAPVADAPIPDVDVKNIGMHVGGGKNDASEKAPIHHSVEPHMDDFKKCFAKVDDPKKGGDFGLDLHVDRAGGKATTSHVRTTIKGDGFKECMVAAFEAIDFDKPKGGTTTVSYSVRFTPKKKR
jgi:hypothetical protein